MEIDYETIKRLNPKIIYCSLSGYGQDGPYANLPGHDVNYISFGGALALIGNQDGPPVIPLNLIADFAGASRHGISGILSALIARQKTAAGQYQKGVKPLSTGLTLTMPYIKPKMANILASAVLNPGSGKTCARLWTRKNSLLTTFTRALLEKA